MLPPVLVPYHSLLWLKCMHNRARPSADHSSSTAVREGTALSTLLMRQDAIGRIQVDDLVTPFSWYSLPREYLCQQNHSVDPKDLRLTLHSQDISEFC